MKKDNEQPFLEGFMLEKQNDYLNKISRECKGKSVKKEEDFNKNKQRLEEMPEE